MFPPTSKITLIGFTLMILSVVFFIAENCYFGWHFLPKSLFELMCDVVCLAMWSSGTRMILIVVRELEPRSKYYKHRRP